MFFFICAVFRVVLLLKYCFGLLKLINEDILHSFTPKLVLFLTLIMKIISDCCPCSCCSSMLFSTLLHKHHAKKFVVLDFSLIFLIIPVQNFSAFALDCAFKAILRHNCSLMMSLFVKCS